MFNGLFQRSDGLFCVRFRPSTGRLNGTDTPYKGGRTVVPFSQRSVLKRSVLKMKRIASLGRIPKR